MGVYRCLLVSAALLSASCATTRSAGPPKVSSPFTESDRTLFEDGVDLLGYPEGLSGRWADDWANELQARVERSDLIALLTVNTLRTDVSPEQHSTHWLVAEPKDMLKGGYGGELSLPSADDAIGFDSVDRERRNLLHKQLIVFVKWVQDDVGTLRAHWHLANATADIVDAVRSELAQDEGKIVERKH
jgi:hypothetical protein